VSDSDSADFDGLVEQLRDAPEFLAGWLAATPDVDELLSRLGLDESQRQLLQLCRAPRADRFTIDVAAIAEYLHVDALGLATTLREASARAALAGRPAAEVAADRLAAAHDTEQVQLAGSVGTARLRRLAEETWAAAPAPARAVRDVEAAIAWSSPVAVVSLPRLALPAVNRWLSEHGIPRLDSETDLRLHGLLVAWRGHGLIFVDGTLGKAGRRFVIAHEQGHFLLDYAEPRRRVLTDAPDLLAVLDGERSATAADRARAALARVPLGVHQHLLRRDPGGGAALDVVASEDDASQYALELLAPWADVLRQLRGAGSRQVPYAAQLRAATEVVVREFAVPGEPARSRAAAALDELGVRRGFFER
jgi:hypothetical protein